MVATCVALFVTIGSLVYYSWQSRRADARVKQFQTLANSTISDMTEKLQNSSASVETRAALFQSILKYLEQMRQTSGNDPRLLLELSKAYSRVGDLQGSPTVAANLGKPDAAKDSYKMAAALALESHRRLRDDESTRAAIDAYYKLGEIHSTLGNSPDASDSYRHALLLATDFSRQKPNDPERKRLLVMNYSGLGFVEFEDLQTDVAVKNFRSALETFGDNATGDLDHDRTILRLHWLLGLALNELGSQTDAAANLRTSISIAQNLAKKISVRPAGQTKRFCALLRNRRTSRRIRDAQSGGLQTGPDVRSQRICNRESTGG
ncbi:MAG: hypothetical protein JO097_18015 [Acidobacteriaceae bacterium]|nr:hypothetical protein [Acidobacteriaceae bacterium]MBV9296372.1 hypothetical protein [Acidobacteriaceae bacterium]